MTSPKKMCFYNLMNSTFRMCLLELGEDPTYTNFFLTPAIILTLYLNKFEMKWVRRKLPMHLGSLPSETPF